MPPAAHIAGSAICARSENWPCSISRAHRRYFLADEGEQTLAVGFLLLAGEEPLGLPVTRGQEQELAAFAFLVGTLSALPSMSV